MMESALAVFAVQKAAGLVEEADVDVGQEEHGIAVAGESEAFVELTEKMHRVDYQRF